MADKHSPEISLRAIDSDHLADVEDNPEALQFRVRLSAMPSDIWLQEFDLAYRQTPYQIKPPAQIVGDMLEIIYLPRYASELPGFFRFLVFVVQKSNLETRRTEDLHTSGMQDQRRSEFREALRRIEL